MLCEKRNILGKVPKYNTFISNMQMSYMCNQINPKLIPGSPRISSPPGPISLELCFYSIKICYYCSNNQLFSVWKLWESKYIFYRLVLDWCFLVWDGNLFGILYFSELWRATWEIWLEAKCWFCPGWEPGRLTNPIQNCKGGLHCKKVL